MATHYDSRYFAYQAPVGQFGAWADSGKFVPYVKSSDDVLDFGCGGGFLLAGIECRSRSGVEVGPAAAETAKANGLTVYSSSSELPDAAFDVVISNHALEHTYRPLDELRELYRALRPGGRIVMVTPAESAYHSYDSKDENYHLYTWSPMNLGNLLKEAGFVDVEARALFHRWPPKVYRLVAKVGGRRFFDLLSRAWARLIIAEAQSIATGSKAA